MSDETPVVLEIKPSSSIESVDRVTCRLDIHHEHFGDTPHSVSAGHSSFLETKEQPWKRSIEVVEGSPVSYSSLRCWIERSGMIIVENKVGKQNTVTLSKEAREEQKKKILRVYLNGTAGPYIKIKPQMFAVFEADLTSVVFVSESGVIPVLVNVLPE